MSNNNNKQLGEAPWLHVIISTGLGAGFAHLDRSLLCSFSYRVAGGYIFIDRWFFVYWRLDR